MKTIIATILVIHVAVISCAPAHGKCQKITIDDEGSEAYTCIQATHEDSNNLPHDTKLLQYTVSKLSNLPDKAFAMFDLHGLAFYNCEIGYIHPNAFDGLEKLQQLTFYGSNIHVVKSSWFKHLSSLTHLFLDQNDMVYIEPMVFSLIPNLEYLNVEDNNLNCLPKNTLAALKKLKYIRINENPWLCSCYAELVEWTKNQEIDHGTRNGGIECMVEYNTWELDEYKTEALKIQEDALSSKSEYFSISPMGNVLCIGKEISILSQIPDNVQSITFLDSQIPEISQFAFFRFGNTLKYLEFSNCSIREIHPEAFAGLSKLKQMILFNNSIGIVKAEWFTDLHSLKHLALDRNEIENIQSDVFPLLDKLESLSLRKNDIGCFPLGAFSSMKNLRDMNIANNTWICRCLEDLRNWINQSNTDCKYSVLPTQCTDNKTHMNGHQYITGYRNLTFQQSFEDEDAKIMSENAELVSQSKFRDLEPYIDIHTTHASTGNQNAKVILKEVNHERNKEIANYEYYLLRTNKNRQSSAKIMQAKYDGYERKAMPNIPLEYISSNIQSDEFTQSIIDMPAENSSIESSSLGVRKSYVFVGLTLWDILISPTDAEAIRFEKASIPEVIPNILSRFHNLRSLKYVNCGVQEILPYAFEGLVNLQELVLDDNDISVVRPVWFEHIPNLEQLSLKRNSITRIEKGVFKLLPNLKYLGISDNQLKSIDINGLSYMKKLYQMDVGKHPCSCACQIKLREWLIDHEVSYDYDFELEFDKIKNSTNCVLASLAYHSSEMTDDAYQNQISVDMEELDNENSVEENTVTIQRKQSPQGIIKEIQETEEVMENSKIIENSRNNTIIDEITSEVKQTNPTPTPTTEPDYSLGRCKFHQFNRLTESRWWCSGGDLSILDQIPSSAERIDLIDSDIPVIPADAFIRFPNLTKLLFYNNSIRDVDSMAFARLPKLDWLVLLNNSLPIIRSSWFYDLQNITLLGLVRNSITEIEPDVFYFLPNLKQLSIQENNLRCIYTKSLSYLKNLQSIRMHDNPWKWRCREEMTQFFDTNNISYVKSETYDGQNVISDLLIDEKSESI